MFCLLLILRADLKESIPGVIRDRGKLRCSFISPTSLCVYACIIIPRLFHETEEPSGSLSNHSCKDSGTRGDWRKVCLDGVSWQAGRSLRVISDSLRRGLKQTQVQAPLTSSLHPFTFLFLRVSHLSRRCFELARSPALKFISATLPV